MIISMSNYDWVQLIINFLFLIMFGIIGHKINDFSAEIITLKNLINNLLHHK